MKKGKSVMNYSDGIEHVIRPGDTIYMLANYYNTTVEEILANNRQINPYDLHIGDVIVIYPKTIHKPMEYISVRQMELSDRMNTLWEQHVFWTRLLLISIAENLNDLSQTQERLLRNPKDIGNIYQIYYGREVANEIEQLLTEHLVIGANLITALKNGETDKARELNSRWHKNADDMARAFSSINPYYKEQEVRQMLYRHLELTTEEVSARLRKDYQADINAFDRVEEEALMMARYFTNGIWRQFPDRF